MAEILSKCAFIWFQQNAFAKIRNIQQNVYKIHQCGKFEPCFRCVIFIWLTSKYWDLNLMVIRIVHFFICIVMQHVQNIKKRYTNNKFSTKLKSAKTTSIHVFIVSGGGFVCVCMCICRDFCICIQLACLRVELKAISTDFFTL